MVASVTLSGGRPPPACLHTTWRDPNPPALATGGFRRTLAECPASRVRLTRIRLTIKAVRPPPPDRMTPGSLGSQTTTPSHHRSARWSCGSSRLWRELMRQKISGGGAKAPARLWLLAKCQATIGSRGLPRVLHIPTEFGGTRR